MPSVSRTMFKPLGLAFLIALLLALAGCTSPATEPSSPPTHSAPPAASNVAPEPGVKYPNTPVSNTGEATTPPSQPQPEQEGAVSPAQPRPQGLLKVHFIDVGQADSIFIQAPDGKAILVDGGNNADGDLVVRYLKDQGVKELAAVVATHPHEDHIGGLDIVTKSFPAAAVYMPAATTTTETFKDFITAVNASRAKRIQAKAGVKLAAGEQVTAQFVAPVGSGYEDLNDWSAVLRLAFGGTSFLLTGDAEAVSEKQMVSSGQELKSTLLKVGHHGSQSSTSAAFLKAVSPKYAVISVGAGNDYGHPDPDTLARLDQAGVKVYRTDEAGTIVATSDGKTITLNKNASVIKPRAPNSSSSSAPTGSSAVSPVPVSPGSNDNVIVYITKTGTKYHEAGCRYLSKSQIPISLREAKARGYGSCSICDPPV